jgi:hypothetical protein
VSEVRFGQFQLSSARGLRGGRVAAGKVNLGHKQRGRQTTSVDRPSRKDAVLVTASVFRGACTCQVFVTLFQGDGPRAAAYRHGHAKYRQIWPFAARLTRPDFDCYTFAGWASVATE